MESVVSNRGDTVGEGHGGEVGEIVESMFADGGHAVIHREGGDLVGVGKQVVMLLVVGHGACAVVGDSVDGELVGISGGEHGDAVASYPGVRIAHVDAVKTYIDSGEFGMVATQLCAIDMALGGVVGHEGSRCITPSEVVCVGMAVDLGNVGAAVEGMGTDVGHAGGDGEGGRGGAVGKSIGSDACHVITDDDAGNLVFHSVGKPRLRICTGIIGHRACATEGKATVAGKGAGNVATLPHAGVDVALEGDVKVRVGSIRVVEPVEIPLEAMGWDMANGALVGPETC